jgi:hypothetical protein
MPFVVVTTAATGFFERVPLTTSDWLVGLTANLAGLKLSFRESSGLRLTPLAVGLIK